VIAEPDFPPNPADPSLPTRPIVDNTYRSV
jgi:hypothetical protein